MVALRNVYLSLLKSLQDRSVGNEQLLNGSDDGV
jgi:hypothetical protein